MSNIVFVEDDKLLNEGVCFALRKNGHIVNSFLEGVSALKELNDEIDIVILDISLPMIDGFEIAKRVKNYKDIPVIFLTAKNEEIDMLKGYSLGCEDYVTKPFSLAILLEKINVALRRNGDKSNCHKYKFDDLEFDFINQSYLKKEEILKFTVTEIKLLEMLIEHKNQILTKDQLLENIWGIDGEFVDVNTLSVNIRRIRKKIENDPSQPKFIKTVFGIGYKWSVI